jgi:aminoglycoside phosphotransferase (APT) family kinase protein
VSQQAIDQPTNVRIGEEIPVENLLGYLRENLPIDIANIEIFQFPGGHSNLTYLVKFGEAEYILRRPPIGAKIKSAHDMGREYAILSSLEDIYSKIPKPILHCEDESIIGSPFYLMTRVEGVVLRKSLPKGIELTEATMRELSTNFIDNLVDIHTLNIASTDLRDFGEPQGYVERQISGWIRRYKNAKTEENSQFQLITVWLNENTPKESSAALIHNDYKYDNLILSPSNVTNIEAVLDWEMATVGDPLMDFGCTLCYWIEPNDPTELHSIDFGLTTLPGNLSRTQLVERYFERSPWDERNMLYYYVYGLFKLAVIIQQIYARYANGITTDKRFAQFNLAVRALGEVASLAINKKRIDNLSS